MSYTLPSTSATPLCTSSSPPPPPSFLYQPPPSQTNANSNPPLSSQTPSLPSFPPFSIAPPPYPLPTTPPPVSQPPPPSLDSPPTATSPRPPPTIVSSPPPIISAPPPASTSSPPMPLAYPAPRPSPTLSPPPPSTEKPPLISPPSPSLPSPPPSTPTSPPPPVVDYPLPTFPPPYPLIYPSPPPPLANPPTSSSPRPPPPPPPVQPPTSWLPPPLASSPPPPVSLPSPPHLPPKNSSTPPSSSNTPSLPSPTDPSRKPPTPIGTNATRSSTSRPQAPIRPGGGNSTGDGFSTGNVTTIAVVAGLVVLTFVGAAVWLVRKPRKPAIPSGYAVAMPSLVGSLQMSDLSYPGSPPFPLIRYSSGSNGHGYSPSNLGLGSSKLWFTYEELSTITNGFSTQNLLGEGGFGCVYKGRLQDGREVAVKQLRAGSSQGEREFKAEVEIIGRVHHRHLVSLVGYCISEQQRLLVYDYVPNDTLYHHLHGKGDMTMDWATRVKVAADAARGLAYLHEDCHPRIIHRDIKSSNILLDNNFEAQVSDFGLARLSMDACTPVTTRVMGTFGYLAPEYASTGKLTAKSDVYSFGVILLELVTGRKPVDASQPLGDESLVEWARPLLSNALESGDFGDLPDSRLAKNYIESEMLGMIEAAAACVRRSAPMRPQMGQVVRALGSLGSSDINNGVKPGKSGLFLLEPQSEEITRFQRMAFGSQDYSSDFSRTTWKSRRDL